MDIQIQVALIGVIAVLIGSFIAVRVSTAEEKSKNRAKFREPFIETRKKVIALVPDGYENIVDILKADYPAHEAAFVEYSNSLWFMERILLSRKWLAYRGKYPEQPELKEEDYRYRFCHYIPHKKVAEPEKRDLVISALERLMK